MSVKESLEKTGKLSFGKMGKYGGRFDLKTQKLTPHNIKPMKIDIKD